MALILNCYKKTYSTNGGDYFTLDSPMLLNSALGVKSCILTIGLNNITENNNKIYIDTGSQSYPVTIFPGIYNYEDLKTSMQSALSSLGLGAFTVTLIKCRYQINAPVAVSYKSLNPISRNIWQMMGIPENEFLTSAGNLPVNISATNYLHISSYELCHFKKINDGGQAPLNHILCSVPVLDSQQCDDKDAEAPRYVYPSIVSIEFSNIKYIECSKNATFQNIDLSIYDDDGFNVTNKIKYQIEIQLI